MQTDPSARHPVDLLADEFMARFRRGERPSIDEYTAKYPELAAKWGRPPAGRDRTTHAPR